MRTLACGLLASALLALPTSATAVVVPGVYNDLIFAYFPPGGDPDNDPNVGTAFDDWDSIPVAFTDPEDNPGFADIRTVKLANDENFLYVFVDYYSTQSVGTFVSFDTDQDVATGFDPFGQGVAGAEASWLNDFPISQINGNFNDGGLTGGPFGNGGAPIFPFFDRDGQQREWMIPLDVTHDAAGLNPVFTSDTFDILIWHDAGQGDLLGTFPDFDVLTYTLAEAPVVPGDYNGDSVVNAADYTVWRDTEGDIGVGLPADGSGDDEVNAADYTIWADNYTGAIAVTATATPEPGTAALLSLGGLALAGSSSRKRR